VCYDADFLPYGAEIDATNTCASNYKFEGKERDAETGNDDFGARYYSSSFGRWLSPDWSAIPAPIPYADITNPQSLNLYSMVRNNPETFADIAGHIVGAFPSSSGEESPTLASPTATQTAATNASSTTAVQSTGPSAQAETQLNVGGVKVNVTLSTAQINGEPGAIIDAHPQGCNDCRWAQTVTATGEAPHTDREADPRSQAQPLYPGGDRHNELYDTPHSSDPRSFTAVSTLGIVNGKNFKPVGSITWGYTVSANGKITLSNPRVATNDQKTASIAVLRRDSPSWNIGP
jgi:RHS repeat-associated protein